MNAVCISCGYRKDGFQALCSNCGFKPESIEDLAKSRILSDPWDFGLPDGEILSTGRAPEELEQIAEVIRSKGEYQYPPDELKGMIWVMAQVESMTGKDVVFDFLRWLLPPVALLAAAWFLISKLN